MFSKTFAATDVQLEMLGPLVTGMLQFSVQRTGMSVSYIELSEVGVAVSQNLAARAIVAVDKADGQIFAKLLANETLRLFTVRFGQEIDKRVLSVGAYAAFSGDIAEAVRNSVRPVLDDLATNRGVVLALLTTSQGNNVLHSTQDVDKISVLAHHSRLLDVASDLLSSNDKIDHHCGLSLKNGKTTLMLYRIERCSLAVVLKNKIGTQEECMKHLEESVILVRKLLTLASNLTGSTMV